MKKLASTLLRSLGQRLIFWAAIYDLRMLEATLQGQCNTLPDVTDIPTRADMAAAIKQLSLAVVAARNRVRELRPVRYGHKGWKTV